MAKIRIFTATVIGCCFIVMFLYYVSVRKNILEMKKPEGEVSLVSVSPDNRWKVKIFEKRWTWDRNFEVYVVDMRSGDEHLVFSSPDEPTSTDGQAILWAMDSNAFVLLGPHFYTSNNTCLYLLYDIVGKTKKCNATQTRLQGFTKQDLVEAYGFQADGVESAIRDVQKASGDNGLQGQEETGDTWQAENEDESE